MYIYKPVFYEQQQYRTVHNRGNKILHFNRLRLSALIPLLLHLPLEPLPLLLLLLVLEELRPHSRRHLLHQCLDGLLINLGVRGGG